MYFLGHLIYHIYHIVERLTYFRMELIATRMLRYTE